MACLVFINHQQTARIFKMLGDVLGLIMSSFPVCKESRCFVIPCLALKCHFHVSNKIFNHKLEWFFKVLVKILF